jgi:hypothetical protein
MRLKPPKGYASWLDYAIDTMEVRELYLDSVRGEEWDRAVSREEMREAAKAELAELRREAANPAQVRGPGGPPSGTRDE